MGASRGFGGRALWVLETTEGTTPTNPVYKKFSDHVQSVALSFDPNLEEWRDIGDYDAASLESGLPVQGVKISFLLHTNRKDPVDDAVARQANNSVKSYSIEVGVDIDGAAPGFFTLLGSKASDVTVKCEVGKPTMVEITYSSLSSSRVTSAPSVGTGSRESAALGALTRFKTSTIRRGGSAVAYITRSAEFKVSHKFDIQGTDGQTQPKAIFEGGREVTGKMDISIDDGGVALSDAVMNGTAASVEFNLGSTGAPKFTLANVQWENLEIPLDAERGVIITGVPFRAKGSAAITAGTVA